uniref:Ankyrin repeat domain-containing protein n=1 Tax=Calcidiscus leptoporus TaxID=127549 RepID=A0A7S0NYZ2_9EUKA
MAPESKKKSKPGAKAKAHAKAKSELPQDPYERSAALYNAAADGQAGMMLELLELGIDVNARVNGDTALSVACRFGNNDCVKMLLDHDANVITTTAGGSTALHAASLWGRVECVKLLLAAGASVNTKFGGRTSLQMAQQRPHSAYDGTKGAGVVSHTKYAKCAKLLEAASA